MKAKITICHVKTINREDYREVDENGKYGPIPNDEQLKDYILDYDINSGEFLSEVKDEEIKIELED